MSIACCFPILECVYCLACARWVWKRCLHTAGHDSETWGLASAVEFEPVPRLCRYLLSVYEDDLDNPVWAPPGGYRMNPRMVIRRRSYADTYGRAPPYLIYLDHDHSDIVLAIRGLNLAKESDYALLLDNRLGKRKFDGGYVHNGLLKAAGLILDLECDLLRELIEKYPDYTLTFAGHSLGAGVAAMLAMVVVQNRDRLGNVESTLKEREHETRTEALIALSLGFPIDALLPAELAAAAPLSAADVNNYIVVRNHILARWRANVRSHLSIPQIRESVSADYDHLITAAFSFLSEHGYINFGVSSPFNSRNDKDSVIIIGAGLAGLAAARQLLGFGFKVIVLEGRCRPGGRVFTFNSSNTAVDADIDLGGSVITGIHANPLGVLARQLGIPLHKIRDRCPLFRPDGAEVDRKLDNKIDSVFNRLLDKATELRETLGESADDISLGSAIERLRELFAVARGGDERELLDWHLANLEYANAGCLSDLSLAHWDQDDPFEMDGDHCFLAGGNWRLINALCEDVPVLYGKTVTRIAYGDDGVEVVVAGGQVFQADMLLCTVPLGILKHGSIKFDPELPNRKLGAIERLGFGLLNKVAMVFPHVFWGEDLDTFGCLNNEQCKRGEFFLFYSYHTVSGGPVLIALVAGEAALASEDTDPVLLLHRVLGVLRGFWFRG